MIEGKYLIKFNTPMGQISGNLELKVQNESLSGTLEIMAG